MTAKVLLVSPYRFLNTALSRLMSDELDLECELCGLQKLLSVDDGDGDGEHQDVQQLLLLLDYMGFDPDTLSQAIGSFQENAIEQIRISAIYNVARDAGIEQRMLDLGVRGIFYDDYELDLFKKGVSSLLEDDIWFPRKVLFEHIRKQSRRNPQTYGGNNGNSPLTPREEEILLMISAGKSNSEIAEGLYISQSTVKTHVYNIFQKINVPNRIQAALWTVKNLGGEERMGSA